MPASCRFAMGVHTLLLLAHSDGDSMTSAQIAGSTNTNPVVVRRLLCALGKAGLVQTQKGPHGGARLTHGAEHITLGAVYRAVETAEPLNRPRARPNLKCPVGARMEAVLNRIFAAAQKALEHELDETSLVDFVVAYETAAPGAAAKLVRPLAEPRVRRTPRRTVPR